MTGGTDADLADLALDPHVTQARRGTERTLNKAVTSPTDMIGSVAPCGRGPASPAGSSAGRIGWNGRIGSLIRKP